MKTFKDLDGHLVSITTEHVYPPIPYRHTDWCACFTRDEHSECPDYGWGATAEAAIDDLIDSYDYEDTLPSFAELYLLDEFYARCHWQRIEAAYQ